jgi:hypothetical protein
LVEGLDEHLMGLGAGHADGVGEHENGTPPAPFVRTWA